MKFRGKMTELLCIQHFIRVINTLSRLSKIIVLRLTTTKIYFVLNNLGSSAGVSIWCEINEGNIFNEYNMEGVSKDDNEIYLELIPENLAKALKVAQNAKNVKIKLTNKHAPCLTVEIESPSLTQRSRVVVHDVPVTVIPRRLWKDYEEPKMSCFDVSLYLPPIKTMKNVVERMKNLGNYMSLRLNNDGRMSFKVETDQVVVSTVFKDLSKPISNKQESLAATNKDEAEVTLDIKKLSHFLSGQQLNPAHVVCNVVDKKMIQLFMLHDNLSLQYYIMGVIT